MEGVLVNLFSQCRKEQLTEKFHGMAAQQQCNTFVAIYFLRFPTIWQIRLTIAYIYYSSIYVKYISL